MRCGRGSGRSNCQSAFRATITREKGCCSFAKFLARTVKKNADVQCFGQRLFKKRLLQPEITPYQRCITSCCGGNSRSPTSL